MKEIIGLNFIYKFIGSQPEEKIVEIDIKDIIPDSLSYKYSPNFSGQGTLGRMSPIQIYSGGSPRTYSFTLTLHEDCLESTNYNTLTGIVDALKSLSYPIVSKSGIMKKPSVFYTIGSISGMGIVQTNISWKKPFRDGRYIMADISFNITEELKFPRVEPRYEVYEEKVPGSSYMTYNNRIKISEYWANLSGKSSFYAGIGDPKNYLTDISPGPWDSSITDFVDIGYTKQDNSANVNFTRDYFDKAEGLLDTAFDMFSKRSVDSKKLEDLEDSIEELGKVTLDLEEFGDDYKNGLAKTPSKLKDLLKNIEDNFTEYLDYYYDTVDTSMTREEYNKVLEEVQIILGQMEDMYEAVYSYGASD